MNQSESFTGNPKILALMYFLKEDSRVLSGRVAGKGELLGKKGLKDMGGHKEQSILAESLKLLSFFKKFLAAVRSKRILVPQPGMNPYSLQWKQGVLTAGPPDSYFHFELYKFLDS